MSKLFSPITIGSMVVKNSFVRSATQDFLGNVDGSISENELALYETLAKNDVGLIITAHTYVKHPLGRASIRQNGIYDDYFITGYQKVADAVHKHGAKLVMQISHAGRQTTPSLTENLVPIGPSAVTDNSSGITPREMTQDEIWQLIEDFSKAIARSAAAKCDGVQLHIAHGYALSQFMSPYTNRRNDEWGGSIENRTRILTEILIRGKKLVGNDYPILVKLNSTDGFSGEGYLTLEDVLYTARLLETLGVCAIEVSGGIKEAKGAMSRPGIISREQEAYFGEAAMTIKGSVKIPVILVGGIRSIQVMETLLANGTADMIALSRPFIKEPDLIVRLRDKKQQQAACVSCNACFNPSGLKCYFKGKSTLA